MSHHHHMPQGTYQRKLEIAEDALAAIQLEYGVDPTAFLRVYVANDLALGAKLMMNSRDYDSSKKGPIRQHIDEDDWKQRKYEFEAEIQKHIRCNLCLRYGMCLLPPPCCCLLMPLTGAVCPDDQDDIDRITDETISAWNMKDAGRIQWSVITRPSETTTQAKGVFGGTHLMARDLAATSMVPPGGQLFALGVPRATPGQPQAAMPLPTAPPAAARNDSEINLSDSVISEQPPSYAEMAAVNQEPDEVTKPTILPD